MPGVFDTPGIRKAVAENWPAVREMFESEKYEEVTNYERERTAEPHSASAPASTSVSVADLAASIESSTEFRSVAADLAERNLDRLLFDVTSDNRVVLSLTGSALAQYKTDWLAYNSGRLDRVPFSTYLARRVASCSPHSSDKSLYFRAEDVAALEKLADDNFQSPRDVLSWIERTLSVSVLDDDGNPLQLQPIPPEVWERIESRKWDEETPAMYIDRVIRRSVGAD